MKTYILMITLLASLTAAGQPIPQAERQWKAKPGETVLVVVTAIRNEKKAEYET